MNINWYPGHMAKTRRELSESISLVNMAAEIVDARIPRSSRNPVLAELLSSKPSFIIFNRADQADPAANKIWLDHYKKAGIPVVETDSKTGRGVGSFAAGMKKLMAERLESYVSKGQTGRVIRVMVVGIPNVGKSSFINRLSGAKPAKAEDRPGVTRKRQWIQIEGAMELLDTPGILWPKLDDPEIALNLAFTGAIRDDVLDIEGVAEKLLVRLAAVAPDALASRYNINLSETPRDGHALLEAVARRRGFIVSGGETDGERTSRVILDEFRSCKIGRITLELPE